MATSSHTERADARSAGKTPGAVVVERVTTDVIPDVTTLYKRVWDRFPDLPTRLAKAWSPSPLEFTSWMEGVVYFAARSDGKIVGVIGLEIADGSGRLVGLAVDEESRRKGVGTALVKQGLEWAKKSECASVWADALSRFGGAAALLKKLGFAEGGVLHRHKFNEDVRLFEKLL